MKKFFLTMCVSTPSVKGIYTALFILILSTSAFAQIEIKGNIDADFFHKWELGINLNILTLKDDPYSIVLKKHLSKNVALRLGLSLIYNTEEQNHFYNHPYGDTIHFLIYSYKSRDKNLTINSFVGVQYGIRKKNWYWYMATDALFKYGREKSEMPSGLHIGLANLAPYQFFRAGHLGDTKIIGFGLKQSLGLQYFIVKSFSVGAEASFLFEANRLIANDSYIHIISDGTTTPGYHYSYSYITYPTLKYWNHNVRISPIALLSFNYYF